MVAQWGEITYSIKTVDSKRTWNSGVCYIIVVVQGAASAILKDNKSSHKKCFFVFPHIVFYTGLN